MIDTIFRKLAKAAPLGAAALAVALSPATVAAQEVEYDAIEEKNLASGKEVLDPAKGYIFLHAPARDFGVFIKQPDEADLALYQEEWEEEFAKAQKKYPGRMKRYERRLAAYNDPRQRGVKPDKPIEPTRETFRIEPIEKRMVVSFGPQFVYSKGKDERGKFFSYLVEVPPGNYTYYGPVFLMPDGNNTGRCYCMGSVRFDVPAGQVTTIGDLTALRWASEAEMRQAFVVEDMFELAENKPIDWSVPDSLSALPSQRADLRASSKLNNYYGIPIARMPPLDGVLAYDRDIPVDVKAQAMEASAEGAAAEVEALAEASVAAVEAMDEVEEAAEAVEDAVEKAMKEVEAATE